jgi:hypothetical protein
MPPYLMTADPKVVAELHRKLWRAIDGHLLWAFNTNYPSSARRQSRASR